MENLVGRKVKYIGHSEFMWFGRKESYEIECQDIKHFYLIDDNGIRNAIENNSLRDYFEFIDEPQFKQGDKVLFTDDLVNWEEGIFLVKHDESYIVESDEILLYAIEIKPYEDEIKVGDWVHNRNGCIMKCDDVDIFNINNWTKITDEALINKLNEL